MKQFLFSFLCLTLSALSANAQGVEISEDNFPNETFRTDVANMFDSDQDGWLSKEEIANATNITYGLGAPADVEGIRYFTSLETLHLNNAPTMTTLDIHGMTSLKILVLGGLRSLASINAAGCTALEDVRAVYDLGSLCSVDFSDCPSLRKLTLNETGLTSFDASPYENLTKLYVSGPSKGGHLTSLDVSHNSKLTMLDCGFNQLTTLNLSANTELEQLTCRGNKLTELDLSANTKLMFLDCPDNELTALDLSKNVELKSIWCSRNQLTTLDLSKNTELEDLSCSENQLTSIDVSGSSKLWSLSCESNRLTTLLLPSVSVLKTLECWNNSWDKTLMDKMISCLPNMNSAEFRVVNETSGTESNICTPDHVAAAKAKGWIAQCRADNGIWTDYEGRIQEVLLDENATTAPVASDGAVNARVVRTLKANEWSTICLPFAMSQAQVKEAFGSDVQIAAFNGYEAKKDSYGSVQELNVKFSYVTSIEANQPYIIKVSSPLAAFSVDGVVIAPAEKPTVAAVARTDEQWSEMTGTYVAGTPLAERTLFLTGGNFKYSAGSTKMKAFRAWFDFSDVLATAFNTSSSASAVKMFVGGEETQVEALSVNAAPAAVYDLSGRKVSNPQHGIFIVNGKKVVK